MDKPVFIECVSLKAFIFMAEMQKLNDLIK